MYHSLYHCLNKLLRETLVEDEVECGNIKEKEIDVLVDGTKLRGWTHCYATVKSSLPQLWVV